jgi:1,4-alpha-glucan branching enzyme
VKDQRDDQWSMGHLAHVCTDRRHRERVISYTECHDQALVGDKSLAFHLMDAAMYTHMTTLVPRTPTIDRGLALLKLFRLLVATLAGDAYLNFIGNEFGHPEWLDFPRVGNQQR